MPDRGDLSCDLLVVGSGAAGLSAAVTAAHNGLKVIVVEKAPVLGGTTAWSGGWIFAPRNALARRAGIVEDFDAPLTYLQGVLGNNFDHDRVSAFLVHAPRMVKFFEQHTELQFEPGNQIPDTYGTVVGAATGGRSVIAAPYDGRRLGRLIRLLRKPKRETTLAGLTIQAGPDLRAFMTAMRSARSFGYVANRVGRHLLDLIVHGRAMQLRNGSALVARLVRSADKLGVKFITDAPVLRLRRDGATILGAQLGTQDGERYIRSSRGVVLASGGFSQNDALCEAIMPFARDHQSLAVPEASGDGVRIAQEAGADFQSDLAAPAAWCPVSTVRWPDGAVGLFPHIIERGKPGIIAVRRDGRRFCNEGMGYHDYVAALLEATPAGERAESWLICTRAFQRRYGLGVSRPAPMPISYWIKSGYLAEASTIEALARKCGIEPMGLRATIDEWNRYARQGADPAFQRGTTPYQRFQGDAAQTPNPCVAPIEDGPFLAVRVTVGSFNSFAGLRTDSSARVLDKSGNAIPGLFAVGADAASVMGGHYPAGGINLGPALTFGYIAGRTAAGLPSQQDGTDVP